MLRPVSWSSTVLERQHIHTPSDVHERGALDSDKRESAVRAQRRGLFDIYDGDHRNGDRSPPFLPIYTDWHFYFHTSNDTRHYDTSVGASFGFCGRTGVLRARI
jgi:hypothetical protein